MCKYFEMPVYAPIDQFLTKTDEGGVYFFHISHRNNLRFFTVYGIDEYNGA